MNMEKLKFILIVFNGKGWITPLKDLLPKSKFKTIVLELSDRGIFNLSDIFIQKEKGLLSLILNHLELDSQERAEIENLLENLLNDLIKYEEMKRKLLKYSIFILFILFIDIFKILLCCMYSSSPTIEYLTLLNIFLFLISSKNFIYDSIIISFVNLIIEILLIS